MAPTFAVPGLLTESFAPRAYVFQKLVDKATFAVPFLCMCAIGFILDSWMVFYLKLLLLVGFVASARFLGSRLLTHNAQQILPVGTYMAQKLLMYCVWFQFFWTEMTFFSNSVLLLISIPLWYNFLYTVLADPGIISSSIEEKKQVSHFFIKNILKINLMKANMSSNN